MRDPITFADPVERERAKQGAGEVSFYQEALKASQEFRREYKERMNVVKWRDMPLERSADGLIKHVINERNEHQGMLHRHLHAVHPAKWRNRHQSPSDRRGRLRD